jgi:hypothetical protein
VIKRKLGMCSEIMFLPRTIQVGAISSWIMKLAIVDDRERILSPIKLSVAYSHM